MDIVCLCCTQIYNLNHVHVAKKPRLFFLSRNITLCSLNLPNYAHSLLYIRNFFFFDHPLLTTHFVIQKRKVPQSTHLKGVPKI